MVLQLDCNYSHVYVSEPKSAPSILPEEHLWFTRIVSGPSDETRKDVV